MDVSFGGGRKHIVVVDDNPVNLDLAETVLKDEYKVTKLISGFQLLKLLNRIHPDMVLLDIQMPGIDGYQTLKEIRKNPALGNIPVIFLTGQKDTYSEREGFRLGAQDFIGKPFNNEVMLSRIRSQMELYQYRNNLEGIIREKTKRIENLQNVITISWAEVVESRDGTTGSHVRNTARYYKELIGAMARKPEFSAELTGELQSDYVRASYLHDIGKIGIADGVLKKPGPLTEEEFECMKTHTVIGAGMVHKIIELSHMEGFLLFAENMALCHHERWDGCGYPRGLNGEEIPLYVRALSITDVYDALTSVRPYKKAFTHEEALQIMQEEYGKFFCPAVFDVFWENREVMREKLERKKE